MAEVPNREDCYTRSIDRPCEPDARNWRYEYSSKLLRIIRDSHIPVTHRLASYLMDGTSKMGRYVFVQPHLLFGGAESQTVVVANRLAAEGHQVVVMLHRAKGGLLSSLARDVELVDLGIEHHLAVPLMAWRMHRALRVLPPSTVVFKLWSSILTGYMAKKRISKHAYVFHEDLDPSDHAQYIRLGRLKQSLVGFVFRRAHSIVANSEAVASAMVEKYQLRRRPDVITPAIEMFSPRLASRPDDGPIVAISVGSLIDRKGHDVVFAALKASGREVDWHIVGEGPRADQMVTWNGQAPHVQVTLHAATPDPFSILEKIDLLLHGARSEAFGVVLLEALARGIPVVSSNAIGPQEIRARATLPHETELHAVRQPVTLYQAGDADSLSVIIQRFGRRDLPSPMSVRLAADTFDVSHAVQLWETLHLREQRDVS